MVKVPSYMVHKKIIINKIIINVIKSVSYVQGKIDFLFVTKLLSF